MLETKFLESKSLAVILLGNFNPSIFQPFWLAKKELITEQEALDAKIDVIHNELVVYDLGWAKIDVRVDRFEISTHSEPYFAIVKDLIVGIFVYLRETPIRALGINNVFSLNLQDEVRYYDFGNKLAPLSNWDFVKAPRLASLEILERERPDDHRGHYRIRIEADKAVKFGVSVLMNNHFDLDEQKKSNTIEVVSIIEKEWNNSITLAESNLTNIINKLS